MTGVAEDHIPWLDIKMQRLLALTQECDDLGLGEVQDMTTRRSAEMLQSRCRRLEMVTDAPEDGQADSVYVQSSDLLDMWCSTQETIRFMAQYQKEALKGYHRDTKTLIKIAQYGTALRLQHECWPRRIPPNLFDGGKVSSSAACARHMCLPSIVADLGYVALEA